MQIADLPRIQIGDTEIPLHIKKSERSKHISLKMMAPGFLELVLPSWEREHRGLKFIESKSNWVLKNFRKIQSRQTIIPTYKTGSQITLFGKKNIELKLIPSKTLRSNFRFHEPEIPLTNSILELKVPEQSALLHQQFITSCLHKFYLQTAREYLTDRTEHFATLLNLNFNQIRLKDTKSRWGSCSAKKNLNYNYRIILAPKPIVDYLVIHEVCHLQHLDHSTNFWNLVASQDPSYREHQKWLKENGHQLVYK